MRKTYVIALEIITRIDCFAEEINNVYPGQTIMLRLLFTKAPSTNVVVNTALPTSCRVVKSSEISRLIYNNCTRVQYTIHHTGKWCELILSTPSNYVDAYYVKLIPCPLGFKLHPVEGYCQCDPVLTSTTIISITSCNINDQTILCPPNSWISANVYNNSFVLYEVSSHCPFDYCLPQSSHLNLFNPGSQCQFNRTGVLCGKCKEGLSAVFGTSQCKCCTNNFLYIIIPITIAGVMLVLVMFLINLTVTDGTINGFILYVNILSINSPTLLKRRTAAYILISIANLDLGIETCFYNGMDDYAKMWLQLMFPIYLIFIATLLIITSRYSTRIQRLTARRALPVLATLFQLSYTKILRTVSSVLFSYSTITSLPNNKTMMVWSVDANVILFQLKFTMLFIVCLATFLITILFNVILIFTRILSRFKIINYFKPLLDAYQGPYKNQYYYWTGLQLLTRAVFFGTSALDKQVSLTIGIVLLSALEGVHGYVRPFKGRYKNIQELVILFNLIIIFTFSHHHSPNCVIVTISVSVAFAQFTMILLHHIWLFQCKSVLKCIVDKTKPIENVLTNTKNFIIHKWKLENNQNSGEIQAVQLRNAVPDVAYHFDQFREPLIAEEN